MEFGASLDTDHCLGGPTIPHHGRLEFLIAQNGSNLGGRNHLAIVVHHNLLNGNHHLDLRNTIVGSQNLQNKGNFGRTADSLGGKGRSNNAGQRGTPVAFDRRGKEFFFQNVHNLGSRNDAAVVINQNALERNIHLDLGDSKNGRQYLQELGNLGRTTNPLAPNRRSDNRLIDRRIHLGGGYRLGRVATAPGGCGGIVVASEAGAAGRGGNGLGLGHFVTLSLAGLAGLVGASSTGTAGSDRSSRVLGLEETHDIISNRSLVVVGVGIVRRATGFHGRRRTIIIVMMMMMIVMIVVLATQEFLLFVAGSCHGACCS
mmetsp:Transcript_9/g.15  ORF Transcript_9/g.15 Transcript_9/m.15 type:complete len:316 (-) Transcript_9:42-989(-)